DWIFTPIRAFARPDITGEIILAESQPDIAEQTEIVGPVIIQNNAVVNNVIDIDFIEQQTGEEVQVVEPQPVDDPEAASTEMLEGRTLPVFIEEEIPPPPEDAAPSQAVE